MTHTRIKQMMMTTLAGMLLAGFASCSQDATRGSDPQMVDELVSPSLEGITFSLRFSGQDPKEVETRAISHDGDEWTVDQLQVFVFDRDGKFLKREKVAKNKIQGDDTNPTYTYSPEDAFGSGNENKVLQFLFLANSTAIEGPEFETPSSSSPTLQQLKDRVLAAQQSADPKSILTTKAAAPTEYCIPMMAMATLDGGNTLIPFSKGIVATVKLQRIVARIDIVNRIPELKIKKISLHNAFKKSRIGESQLETERLAESVKPYSDLPSSEWAGVRTLEGARLKKAFYLYEGKNTADNYVYVRLEGTLHGAARVYHIPFKKKALGDDKAGEVVDVKRNHLYTIELGGLDDKGEVSFSFADDPWNMHTLYQQFIPIKGAGTDYTITGVDTGEVNVAKTGGNTTVTFSTSFTDAVAYELKDKDTITPDWLRTSEIAGNELTIKAGANNLPNAPARKGKLVVRITGTNIELTIWVTQAANA